MNYENAVARNLGLPVGQVKAAIDLLDAGNTIPFIARYRKEVTGTLDEEQLRQIDGALNRVRSLEERRETILASIDSQGKLTSAIRDQIVAAETLTALEDLYQPYKPKRKTRASMAREKGLQGLADLILTQARLTQTLESVARSYLNDSVLTVDDALAGARDIAAETISDHPEVRRLTREKAMQKGTLRVERQPSAQDDKRVYELYYAFEIRVNQVRPHQVLAVRRGEKEKVLRTQLIIPEAEWMGVILSHFRPDPRSILVEQLKQAAQDAGERLLTPSIERDVWRQLTEHADEHAIQVFATNLRGLLSQPPLLGQVVLGIDPGFRTGCKIAVVDPTGKVLDTTTIYPHEPQKRWNEALSTLRELINQHRVSLIAIGNGTASRESEQLAAQLIRERKESHALHYLITNEAGASVYSASPLARAELPGLDVSLRGAVSIARRAQDSLAELVKIEPRSIGVGLYQHDVDQNALEQALISVVESVVNQVGVDVNTASPALLSHVSGIGQKLAEKIVAYRDQNGVFKNRNQLMKIPGLGKKAFEQSAGFLRIRGGDNPLDESAIHPESYLIAEEILRLAGITLDSLPKDRQPAINRLLKEKPRDQLAQELNTGIQTLDDILEQLCRPGRDPRQDMPAPFLRSDILKMEDLVPGIQLKGVVRNIVDFGAFIDIGVKQDGLLHRSQIPIGTKLRVSDVIEVEVSLVDIDRGRIALKWIG